MSTSSQLNFAYTVVFVPDVEKAIAFYAFGLKRRMVTPAFGQLDTGSVALAFGAESNERKELPDGFRFHESRADGPPAGVQISFTTDDVDASFKLPGARRWSSLSGSRGDRSSAASATSTAFWSRLSAPSAPPPGEPDNRRQTTRRGFRTAGSRHLACERTTTCGTLRG